jgi:hypothetical protein
MALPPSQPTCLAYRGIFMGLHHRKIAIAYQQHFFSVQWEKSLSWTAFRVPACWRPPGNAVLSFNEIYTRKLSRHFG